MERNNDLKAKKRGRKPIGEQAMTPAERKRLSRARQAEDGYVEFVVRAKGETLKLVDLFAYENGVSRSAVVEGFLDMAISLVGGTLVRADKMLAEGATMNDVQQVMREAFTAKNPSAQIKAKTNVITSEVTQLK